MSSHPAGMTYLALNPNSRFYVLHVDGVGDYGATSESGIHCLFLFTSEKTISGFVDRMELPKHKAFTQFGFDLPQLTDLLSDSSRVVDCVAIDPEVSFEFTPVSRVDFLRAITSITG